MPARRSRCGSRRRRASSRRARRARRPGARTACARSRERRFRFHSPDDFVGGADGSPEAPGVQTIVVVRIAALALELHRHVGDVETSRIAASIARRIALASLTCGRRGARARRARAIPRRSSRRAGRARRRRRRRARCARAPSGSRRAGRALEQHVGRFAHDAHDAGDDDRRDDSSESTGSIHAAPVSTIAAPPTITASAPSTSPRDVEQRGAHVEVACARAASITPIAAVDDQRRTPRRRT